MKLIYHQVTHKGADKYRAEKSIDEAIGSILLFGNKIIIGTGRGQIEQWRFHREEFKLVREHVYSYDQVFLFVFFFFFPWSFAFYLAYPASQCTAYYAGLRIVGTESLLFSLGDNSLVSIDGRTMEKRHTVNAHYWSRVIAFWMPYVIVAVRVHDADVKRNEVL